MHINSWLDTLRLRLRSNKAGLSNAAGSSVRRRKHRTPFSQVIEMLEDRSLLSVSALLVGTELTVESDADDSILIQDNGGLVEVIVNGSSLASLGTIDATSVQSLIVRGGDGANTISVGGVLSTAYDNPNGLSILVEGGDGDDSITLTTDFASTVDAGDGNDIVISLDGADTIDGGDGDDQITGGLGNDNISGGDGIDNISGDEGDDIIDGGASDDIVTGDDGADNIVGGSGNDNIDDGAGMDTIAGNSGNDQLDGGDDADVINGKSGNDVINGGDGDDTIDAGVNNDTVNGGDGDDSLLANSGDDEVRGGDGNDFISGSSGNDLLVGDDGNDRMFGGSGNDTMFGDSSDPTTIGVGDDTIKGQSGNDTLQGGGGTDSLDGGEGNDLLQSGDIDSQRFSLISINDITFSPEGDGGTPTPLFGAPAPFAAGAGASNVINADFDQNGVLDLATADTAANTVSILFGNGDGTFQAAVVVTVGAAPSDLAAADIDGDNDLDLLVANSGDNTVSVLTNDGAGGLTVASTPATGMQPLSLISADFDGDGDFDIATADFVDSTVSILANNGAGTFAAPTTIAVGTNPQDVTMADIDNNGDTDLVVTNFGTNNVTVLLNSGTGSFTTTPLLTGGTQPIASAVGDLNGDLNPDIATVSRATDEVIVHLGNGDGTFGLPITFAVGDGPSAVHLADIDNDNDLDVLTANVLSNDVSLLRNMGNASFEAALTFPTDLAPTSLITADYDFDGLLDIVTANSGMGTVSNLSNSGSTPVGATFTVSLAAPSATPVTVNFATADGSAVGSLTGAPPADYGTMMGVLTFAPGITTKTVTVLITGDTLDESDENLFVNLSNASANAVIVDSQGEALIVDDDGFNQVGPIINIGGQVENILPNNQIIGAIHTVDAHPTNADILYIGGVNGGVWRTENATDAEPNWIPLTDDAPSQSIGALEFDPTDPTHRTLVAGVGRFSSFAQFGGSRTGILRTTDGFNFTSLDGGGVLSGANISGVAPRGSVITVSVNTADSFNGNNVGIFRSTDAGQTFTQISSGDGTGPSGLPLGVTYDLAGDPNDPNVLYTGVVFADAFSTGTNGVFRSNDMGATWTRISNAAMEALTLTGATSNLEISVGAAGVVFVTINNQGQLAGVFRSSDGGATFVQMDTPVTNENGNVGINPRAKGPGAGSAPETIAGGQGSIHSSILADPTNPNLVYLGGDRQPTAAEGSGGPGAGGFPNSIGATDFSGRLFRGDASQPLGSQFVHMTHSNVLGAAGGGTANSTSPHADSREMVFDALGNIIEVDDGGIFRRTSPQDNTGDWFSLAGDLSVTEFHDIDYDTISNIVIGGTQDNGTLEQLAAGEGRFRQITGGDGGDVQVDDVTLAASGQSIRYSSFQFLRGFRRRVIDANNNVVSTAFPALAVQGGGAAIAGQFSTPVQLNAVDPTRLIIGGGNSTYESLDMGDTVTEVGPGIGVNSGSGDDAISYGGFMGGVPNEEVLYVGSGNEVFVRLAGTGAPTPTAFPGGVPRDIVLDPTNFMNAYVVSAGSVFQTLDGGGTWTNITGNIPDNDLRSIEFIPGADPAVVVGGRTGVSRMSTATPGTWIDFGGDTVPTVPVWDMAYDAQDNVLVLGTLGRGAFVLTFADVAPSPSNLAVGINQTIQAEGDTLNGSGGNDTIIGTDGNDFIAAGSGNDSISAGEGDDNIFGGSGDDTLDGGNGNDMLNGQLGSDQLLGGNNDDTFIGEISGLDTVVSPVGFNTLEIRGASNADNITVRGAGPLLEISQGGSVITVDNLITNVVLNAGNGADTITVQDLTGVVPLQLTVNGGNGSDTINVTGAGLGFVRFSVNGEAGDDTITGGGGAETLSGGAGNDMINGGGGNDTIFGGDGDDMLDGDGDDDVLMGEAGNDTVDGSGGNDIVSGGDFDDRVIGGDGNDTVSGDDGEDKVIGNAGDDRLLGGNDDDSIFGGSGNDTIRGGNGDDFIRGQNDDDVILGEDGEDTLRGDNGADTIDGGDGADTLEGGSGNDGLIGGDGVDRLIGSSGFDTLIGGDGDDRLIAGGGKDVLLGGNGNDIANGQGGIDTIAGEDGVDTLIAEPGEIDETFTLPQSVLDSLDVSLA
ncbi:MAG: hypothetical protein CMJ78_14815 [Planctomycetaceae bacterium]|nr:hypothetical protein [Planctomycetaceae bacterium]